MSSFDHARNRPRKKGNRTLKHPYAAIEHRVIDSEAFADLKPSSVVLLLILARQLTPTNNGHLQATWKYSKSRGFGSEVTLKNAIADLIKHGFVYRTRSRGPNKAWARYAVTWLPIKQKEGLFLQNFEIDTWNRWEKSTPKKVKETTPKICSFGNQEPTEIMGLLPIKSNDYELIPNINEPIAHLKPVKTVIAEGSKLIAS